MSSEQIFAIVKTKGIIRKGRGFSLDELKEANISLKQALSFGIPVDLRRSTKYDENVQKLKKLDIKELKSKKKKLKTLKPQSNRKRVFRGLTSAGKKMRGLRKDKLKLTHKHKWKKKHGESR